MSPHPPWPANTSPGQASRECSTVPVRTVLDLSLAATVVVLVVAVIARLS